MAKILLVYLPFCTPASPPYSITWLYSFLKNNANHFVDVMDLNVVFHQKMFSHFKEYYQDQKKWKEYDKVTDEFRRISSKIYAENNSRVVNGLQPDYFDLFLKMIIEKKPDIIAFSLVYSSQAFYAYALLQALQDYTCVLGGPAVNDKVKNLAKAVLANEIEFLEFVQGQNVSHDSVNFDFSLDYSIYKLDDYFTPHTVIPLKTTSTCFYQRCSFCTHFARVPYKEYSMALLKKTIIDSQQKYFFLIDDMIPVARLLQLADLFKPLGIRWAVQLRPTKDITAQVLSILKDSGLTLIMWGVESGCQRILTVMKKGTIHSDAANVLTLSHEVGIKNVVYMMVGFPSETKQEFIESIDFLKCNIQAIDLVSFSVFGLQIGAYMYDHATEFGITKIIEKERTVLEPGISYETDRGLSQQQAQKLRYRYKKSIENINKYPKNMNFFREHMFCIL